MATKTKLKIRKDDQVLVIAGNDKGKSGKVIMKKGGKVVVQGVNVRKKHVKPTRTAKGGIIEIETPIDPSNLRVCNAEGKPVKLGVQVKASGERELVFKEGSKKVVHRTLSRKKI